MAANIDFTVTFNVETATAQTYRNFVEDLRRRLQHGTVYSHNRPLLRPQERVPTRWFEVVLTTNTAGRAVTLRVRSDNLYIDGYRAQNVQQWSEFANDANQHLFNGSRFLEFGSNYVSVERHGGGRASIFLGRSHLIDAVNWLFNADTIVRRAQAVIILAQTISEAVRFFTITDFVVTNWTNGARPTPQLVALENGWHDISTALLQQDDDSYGRFRLRPNAMGITSAVQAILYIAILLRPLASRQLRMTVVDDGQPQAAPQYSIGRPLVEVLWVRIDNIDGEDPGDLYGTIKASDGLNTQILYDRDKSNYQSVRPGENAKLTGPPRVISAANDFLIDLSLYDYDADPSPDDEIAKGQISWNVADPFKKYDTLHTLRVSGQHGWVTVNYVVLADACEALIQVILVNGDGENPANVYGTINANNGFGNSQLFKRNSDDYINVNPNTIIPLLRTSMGVARNKQLRIDADLWDQDSLSPDDQIAKGSVYFNPEVATSFNQFITGQHGKIEVRITWF